MAGIALVVMWGESGGVVQSRRPQLLLHDDSTLDFSTPQPDGRGLFSVGMFGWTAHGLSLSGIDVKRQNVEDESSLDGVDAVVVINLQKSLSQPCRDRIHRFVLDGGGLWVLGDHTGLTGIRPQLNELIQRYGVELNFDSAVPSSEVWRHDLRLLSHPTTRGISADATSIGVGASLTVRPPARQVISSRGGFSDPGDPARADIGAIGNLRYDLGERVGDLCLVAESRAGAGRVLVFGDTSPLQNLALPDAFDFVSASAHWISSRGAPPTSDHAAIVAAVGVLILSVSGYWRTPTRTIKIGALTLTCATLLLLGARHVGAWPFAPSRTAALALNDVAPPVAMVDWRHGALISHGRWTAHGLGGLQLNLARCGYWPVLTKSESIQETAASVLLLVSPTRDWTETEMRSLENWVRSGGHLVVTSGHPHATRTPRLLRSLRVTVLDVPLGPAIAAAGVGRVKFHCAYEMLCSEEWQPRLRAFGRVVCAERAIGRGSVTFISDSGFLHNINLEGRDERIDENVAFLKGLLSRSAK